MKNLASKMVLVLFAPLALFLVPTAAVGATRNTPSGLTEGISNILPHHLLAQSDDANGLHRMLRERLGMGLFQRHEGDNSPAMWSVCEQDARGWTVLHHAVAYRKLENIKAIKAALSREQYLCLLQIQTFNSKTSALHFAAGINSPEIFDELLNGLAPHEKASLIMRDGYGIIIKNEQHSEIAACIEQERKKDQQFHALVSFIEGSTMSSEYLTSLQRAAQLGATDHIQEMLKHRQTAAAKIYEICHQNIYGRTALHHAVTSKQVYAVHVICEQLSQEAFDALIEIQDINGDTPMTLAQKLNDRGQMKDLLEAFKSGFMELSHHSPQPIHQHPLTQPVVKKTTTPGYAKPTITSRMNTIGGQKEALERMFQRWNRR